MLLLSVLVDQTTATSRPQSPVLEAPLITIQSDGIRRRKRTDAASPSHSEIATLSPLDQSSMIQRDITEEEEQEQKTCADKVREFGAECRQYFENLADSLIAFFNEISEDYRAIAAQLERERKEKYKDYARQQHQRHQQRQQQQQQESGEGQNGGARSKGKVKSDFSKLNNL